MGDDVYLVPYIGIRDQEGSKIYEGTILDIGGYLGVVEWGLDNDENDLYRIPGFVIRMIPDKDFIFSPIMSRIMPINKFSGVYESKVVGHKLTHPKLCQEQ